MQAERAVAELDRVEDPDELALGKALALGAWGASVLGRLEDADRLLARVAQNGCDDPDLGCAIASAHAFRALADGRLEDAVEVYRPVMGSPGLAATGAYGMRISCACILAVLGRHEEGLRCVEEGLGEVRRLPGLQTPLHALRVTLLTRLGRLAEAREAVALERLAAERSGDLTLRALADHDEGMVAFAAGEHAQAAELVARGLEHDAAVNRPLARLVVAESLARQGRADEAETELRLATLEPVAPGDRPAVLVARLTHVQGLVALARGDVASARRRVEEAAAGWRRLPVRSDGGELSAILVDLGRPTLAPVEPARELARVERELEELHAPLR
jgi:tetratricopeptide (TPR) repeat protein